MTAQEPKFVTVDIRALSDDQLDDIVGGTGLSAAGPMKSPIPV
ncbi:hypothetical protein [Nocardia sp. NPDC059691]